jgi:hypothetical protein
VILRFAILAICSMAMVVAMMQFTYAIISDDPRKLEQRTFWGVIYVALWVGVCLALWDLIRLERTLTTTDWAAIAIAPAGWLTFNALWAMLWGSLEMRDAEIQRREPSPRSIGLKRTGGRLTIAGLAIVAALLVAIGAPQAFVLSIIRTTAPATTAAIALTVAGWALLVWGGARLALGIGQTKTEDYGRLGKRKTASGEVEISFSEFKDAWRRGLWIRDARWRTVYMMALGAICAAYGLFGLFIVQGPLAVRILCGGALLYATARTVAGFWRA